MAYDRDDIEKVRQSTSIVELVEGVTTVRKRGRSFKAICPFHQEKTPSMSLDPARGFYHCFGCNAGGDVFKFVMETQALDFSAAVEVLAARAGVVLRIDPQAAKRRGARKRLTDAVEAAVRFYADRLKAGADAGTARAYLRGRGYEADTVDEFELGYSPSEQGRNTLVRALKSQGFAERQLYDAGLARRGQRGGTIDWFSGRIMFPIRDLRGDAVGFGARLLEGDGPKYLNTPETKLYEKAKLLYGLDRAKAEITRRGFAVVVEGYTDVIALHRAGLPVAVATCGTALGEDHFDLLRRFTERIVLAFDADQAGAGAAIRGDELHLPAELGLDLRVAVMPEGRDPADLVQQGELQALIEAVDRSEPLLQFRIEREVERHPLDEPEGRSRAVKAAAAMLARLTDPVIRHEYARYVARLVGSDTETVELAISSATPRRRTRVASPERPAGETDGSPVGPRPFPPPADGQERAELDLLRLTAAGVVDGSAIDTEVFTRVDYLEVFSAVTGMHPGGSGSLDLAVFGERHPESAGFVRALLLDDRPEADPAELLARLGRRRLQRRIDEVRDRLDHVDSEADPQTHSQLFGELIALERRKRESEEL